MNLYEVTIGFTVLLYVLYRIILDGKFHPEEVNRLIRHVLMLGPILCICVYAIRESYMLLGLISTIVFILTLWIVIRLAIQVHKYFRKS